MGRVSMPKGTLLKTYPQSKPPPYPIPRENAKKGRSAPFGVRALRCSHTLGVRSHKYPPIKKPVKFSPLQVQRPKTSWSPKDQPGRLLNRLLRPKKAARLKNGGFQAVPAPQESAPNRSPCHSGTHRSLNSLVPPSPAV